MIGAHRNHTRAGFDGLLCICKKRPDERNGLEPTHFFCRFMFQSALCAHGYNCLNLHKSKYVPVLINPACCIKKMHTVYAPIRGVCVFLFRVWKVLNWRVYALL